MTNYSLRARMMILILAPTVLIGLLLSIFFVAHRYNDLQRQLEDAGASIIEPLAVSGTVAKLAMRQPFVLFKGLTFQKLCLPGAFRPGDHHNK
ncbi:hypothetical protein M2T73_17615, partial [Klebsiella pneumoniae]|nr:hypothetical protein [Klebsiella pneumoniae]